MKTKTEIEKFNPCREALKFREKFTSFKDAWDNCPRGDWMLWIAQKLEVDQRKLTLAKALCAETVIHLMKDKRSIKAIEVAKAYSKGEVGENELKAAYACADAAAYAADAAYAVDDDSAAPYAASYAASYVAADTGASYVAAYVAAVYNAVDIDDDPDAKKENQKQTADICREILTEEVMSKIQKLCKIFA